MARSSTPRAQVLFRLVLMSGMASQGRALGDEPDASRDQADPDPAQGAHLLMQIKFGNQGQQHVSQRRGGQHVGEISPGEGRHVGGEKSQQKQNPQGDPGIQNGEDEVRQAVQRNVADLLHAAGEKGIANRSEEGDTGQHQILAKRHTVFLSP